MRNTSEIIVDSYSIPIFTKLYGMVSLGLALLLTKIPGNTQYGNNTIKLAMYMFTDIVTILVVLSVISIATYKIEKMLRNGKSTVVYSLSMLEVMEVATLGLVRHQD